MSWKLGSVEVLEPLRGGAYGEVLRSLGMLSEGNKVVFMGTQFSPDQDEHDP